MAESANVSYVLVTMSVYSAGMDFQGLELMTLEQWVSQKVKYSRHFESNSTLEYGIGTDQEISFESLNSLMRCFKETDISKEEFDTMKSLLGSRTFGVGFPVEY